MSLTTNHGIHMNLALIAPPGALLLVAAFIPAVPGPNDRVIQSGETLVYDTGNGPLVLDSLEIQAGGILRVQGPLAFRLHARRSIQIDGTLDMTAFDGPPVFTLNTPNQPELGGPGGPGGGRGGTGSWQTSSVTPFGLDGGDGLGALAGGGGGGESGWSYDSSSNGVHRRPGGGGGGVFGGMLVLQAEKINLAQATGVPLSALGGVGGQGANNILLADCGGGHGGPGLIQLHVPDGDPAHVLLPPGRNLGDLSAPRAHVLMLESSL